jgi:hypothetical protein
MEINYFFPKNDGIIINLTLYLLSIFLIFYALDIYKNKSMKISKRFLIKMLIRTIVTVLVIFIEPSFVYSFDIVLFVDEITPLEFFNKLIAKRAEYLAL